MYGVTEKRVNLSTFSKEDRFEAMLRSSGFTILGYREKRDYTDYYIKKDGIKFKYRFYLYIGGFPAEYYFKEVKRKYRLRKSIFSLFKE